ncbi:class I SAM-dependent methyltransferase [Nonomuraea gerenzanensis]|uniref:SAM-dependent methyltransferase DSY4148 (UbiE paralog) n=1 Tax=Nonomuraea gerenzanensis TaxID=93944 RepID=A0A1M4EPQ0_9ACTN|nr:class I SAM-dependent methyltransferase [Nonomuraea gerenzanensis]UBU12259.1 class I SAM-dependent methyltransferase [Nonomuraea gerenzanensis]SBP00794.1 SAM-dependent methyltransferase DSY4148 (UbiE paralog) [Nonomuraea gerenzanensis]
MLNIANTQQAEAWNGWEGQHWADNPGYYNGMLDGFNEALFTAAAIQPDDQVLDIGCGTGRTTLLAAGRAARGTALGIDLSAPMLERARADAAAQGVTNAVFEQGDAQVHAFAEGKYDVVISRGGVMFFADLVAGFTNIARALRPGGRLAIITSVPGSPDGDYARATAALRDHMRGPSPAAQGMMSMIDPARIHQVLADAGYTAIDMTIIEAMESLGRTADEAATNICAMGPVRFNLSHLDEPAIATIRDEVREGLRPYETPEGVQLRARVRLTTATRP